MHLVRRRTRLVVPAIALLLLLGVEANLAQSEAGVDVDILFNYYEQDGQHSPVTGGIGTEEMDVLSPVVLLRWDRDGAWDLQAQLGIDAITSASTDNIDLGETISSGASRLDNRAHTTLTAIRAFGESEIGVSLGFSKEYDYRSVQGGLQWSRSFRQQNRSFAAALRHYSDTVELYGIDGVERGQDDRTTTDLSLTWTEVLGRRTVGWVELFASDQSGLLSTPFHEVILATRSDGATVRVPERLPDNRLRTAIGLRLHHSFSKRYVQRSYYRFYRDDWGLTASTVELEPHFRLPTRAEHWVFPILRFHTQSDSDYFAPPETFTEADPFFTADRELGEFTSTKLGLGWSLDFAETGRSGWTRRLRRLETRVTSYQRDDDLDALSVSFGIGLSY